MTKDKDSKKTAIRKSLKYSFAALSVGAVVVAPIATVVAQQTQNNQKTTLRNLVSSSYAGADAVTPFSTQVVPGKQLLTDKLSPADFTFSGENNKGTIAYSKTAPAHLDIYVSRNLADPSSWTSNLQSINTLTNNDVVYASLRVKAADAGAFQIQPNAFSVTVSGLTKGAITNPIDNTGKTGSGVTTLADKLFGYTGIDGQGSVYLTSLGLAYLNNSTTVSNNGAPLHPYAQSATLDNRLELQYSTDNGATWLAYAKNLTSGQKFQVRMAVQRPYDSMYDVNTYVANQVNYAPATLTVPTLPAATASTGKALDFNAFTFSGDNGAGTATYNGYNAGEYATLKVTRESNFISGYADYGLNLYDGKTNGDPNLYTFENANYRFMTTTRPFPIGGTTNTTDALSRIVANNPFLIRRASPFKDVQLKFNFLDGQDYFKTDNLTLTGFLSSVTNSRIYSYNIGISFNADGSVASLTKTSVDRTTGLPVLNAQPVTVTPEAYKLNGGTLYKIDGQKLSSPLNNGYIFIDADGNIGTAFDANDWGQTNSAFAITNSITSATYQDGTSWDKNAVNNLLNNEYVSASTGPLPADLTKEASAKVQGLNLQKFTDIPVLTPAAFLTNDNKGSVAIKSGLNTATNDHLNLVNLWYSADGINYSTTLPTGLKNKDVVLVKEVPKVASRFDHVLPPANDQVVPYIVSGVDKTQMPDVIAQSNFSFSGVQESGTTTADISALANKEKVEVQYSDTQGGTYTNTAPTNLKNNQKFWAKLVVLPDYDDNWTLTSGGTPVEITASGFSKKNLTDTIQATDFVASGTAFAGTIGLSSTKTIAPQLQVEYSDSATGTFSTTAPTTLSNQKHVFARLALNPTYASDYTFTTTTPVDILVTGLTHITLPDKLVDGDLTFTGANGSGTPVVNPNLKLADQVEIRYYNAAAVGYVVTPPTDLKNGDTVYAGTFLKNNDLYYNYLLPNGYEADHYHNLITVTVSGLTAGELPDTIVASDFTTSGDAFKGTVALNSSKTLSPQVEVQYGKAEAGPFSTVAPTDLKNGDPLYAKLALKAGTDTNSYKFKDGADTPVKITVNNLKKIMVDQPLVDGDFKKLTGDVVLDGKFSLGLDSAKRTLDPNVKLVFANTEDGDYKDAAPAFVKNGETLYVGLGVIDESNYELSPASDAIAIPFAVDGLTPATISNVSVNQSDFQIVDGSKPDTISVVAKDPGNNLEYWYGTTDASGKVVYTNIAPVDVADQPISVQLRSKDSKNYVISSSSTIDGKINTGETSSSLTSGAIAGIVLGSIAAAVLLFLGAFELRRYLKKRG